MTAAEFIKVRHPQDYDDIPQWHIDDLEAYAAQQKSEQKLREAYVALENVLAKTEAALLAEKEKFKKLAFMIDKGLGWKDMENDIAMPHEL
jgi:hypothetical protein